MADFFGDILDSVRSIGDDASEFFNSSIGNAVGKAIIGGNKKNAAKQGPSLTEGFVPIRSYNDFSPGQAPKPLSSEDFSSVESEWLRRMYRFAGMDTGTDVKLGAK